MEQQNRPVWQQYMPDYVNLYYVDYNNTIGGVYMLYRRATENEIRTLCS